MHPTESWPVPEAWRKDKKLSILMPFLNEEKIIVENTKTTIRIMHELDFNFEIILIDDGSKDHSFELLEQEFKGHPDVKVIRNFQNFGKGWALKTGYEYAVGDFVLFLDSDLELSPYHIPNFFRTMIENGADAVIGSKLHPFSIIDYPLKRRILSLGYYTLIRIFFGLPVMDTQTGIKLFRKEVLEQVLPKVLVKKFAFDIELLIILCKRKYKVESAPIELHFLRGSFGRFKMSMITSMMIDTLAVFYRDKILRFYDRPMGENKKYAYTLFLFPEHYDEYEREALKHFLDIHYDRYEIILLGKSDLRIHDSRVTFIQTEEAFITKRLFDFISKNKIKGDFAVFSKLSSFPDRSFLFTTGRILSLDSIGGAGGFVTPRQNASVFERDAFSVIQSFFLNLTLTYRYKPQNYREVKELHLDGFFVKREIIENLEWKEELLHLKLEYILSRQIRKMNLKLVYSPDLMLYRRFPETKERLNQFIKSEASFRALQYKTPFYRKMKSGGDWKYLLSLFLILFVISSLLSSVIQKTPLFLLPLTTYYFALLLTRFFLYGLKKGGRLFLTLTKAQILYGLFFIRGLFSKKVGEK